MKKILILIAAMALLASCSSKISLVKRKYNKGYYVSVSKKKQKSNQSIANTNIAKKQTNNPSQNNNVVQVNRAIEHKNTKTESGPLNPVTELVSNNTLDSKLQTHGKLKIKKVKSENFQTAYYKNLDIKNQFFGKSEKNQKADADVNTLVLVILSLFPFICLIAVYLKDGKSITLNFIIDLLLHLTVIGEIVYALLVVLDIFSAA